MKIKSRAPLRLGLAGGGTDVRAFSSKYGGCVLNVTIDKYIYTIIEEVHSGEYCFESIDFKQKESYSLENKLLIENNLILHKVVYSYFMEKYNQGQNLPLFVRTYSEVPGGSGLGSSSTMVVSMIKAFMEYFNVDYTNHELARLAYHLERDVCGLGGGQQDQYSATFGGVNFIEFLKDDSVIVNQLKINEKNLFELQSQILLFFSGSSRDSHLIISDQIKSVTDEGDALKAMQTLKDEAVITKNALLIGDFNTFNESILRGWLNKKKSSRSVSTSRLETIYNDVINAGALAGKVSGAGGGGFMWFIVPTELRINVVNVLGQYEGFVANCQFTEHGVKSWKI